MLLTGNNLSGRLKKNTKLFHPVVQFDPGKERLIQFDFSEKY
jgi:hypothetical protein